MDIYICAFQRKICSDVYTTLVRSEEAYHHGLPGDHPEDNRAGSVPHRRAIYADVVLGKLDHYICSLQGCKTYLVMDIVIFFICVLCTFAYVSPETPPITKRAACAISITMCTPRICYGELTWPIYVVLVPVLVCGLLAAIDLANQDSPI
jgi:hypothetical protein